MNDARHDAIVAAIAGLLDDIDADPDPEHAYHRATALSDQLQDDLIKARRARGAALRKLRDKYRWTLDEVGSEVQLSKSRVSQLVSKATG